MVQAGYRHNTIFQVRNFYGSLRVKQVYPPTHPYPVRTLLNGTIQHGTQLFTPELNGTPTTYYAADSGVGFTLRGCCGDASRNIGVVGLGAGTIAAYGRPGDRIRFYEINPAVEPIARNLFTYLRDSAAQITVVPGDARASLARESPQRFNVLVVDAFSAMPSPSICSPRRRWPSIATTLRREAFWPSMSPTNTLTSARRSLRWRPPPVFLPATSTASPTTSAASSPPPGCWSPATPTSSRATTS